MKKNLIFIFILLSSYIPLNNIDRDSFEEFTYHSIACRTEISNNINIENILSWVESHGYKIYKIIDKNQNNFDITYYFTEKNKTIISLQFYFNNKNECNKIILKMCINGSPRIYYDKEAKRILRMLISYNDEFEYFL